MNKNNSPFIFLTAGICCVLFLPALFMDGMFMDGMLYSSVAKNYALGLGTFWEQHFSASQHTSFHEQPPLMFVLEGMFFKVLGLGMYTERIYCLVAALLNAYLIHKCWKVIQSSSKQSWLPILFWFSMPVTFYAFINNLEECTMSLFVLASMLFFLRALHEKKQETLNLFVAGCFIVFAGLTKGIQGMFLLGTPFVWWIIFRQTTFLSLIKQLILVSLPTALFAIYAWLTPAVHSSLQIYFTTRLGNAFTHVNDTTTSHFHLLFELFLDIIPLLLMVLLFLFISRKKVNLLETWGNSKKLMLFFSTTALTGIIPLMTTLEQRGFYLVTALPYIAIAAALLVAPSVQNLEEKLVLKKKLSLILKFLGLTLLISSFVATIILAGKPKRDVEKIHDLQLVATKTGNNAKLRTSIAIECDWHLLTYAQRTFNFSLSNIPSFSNEWYLLEKTDGAPEGYFLVPLSTEHYLLYHKK